MSFLFSALPQFFSKLRAPVLFTFIAALFVLDLIIPDFVPFVDEILLAAGTVMLSRWRKPEPVATQKPNAD